MPARRAASKPSDSYHHGDLRAALIAAAREALETTPPEQLSLKALATRLGVSQPAPYRHFANRDALLAAVAADGFERFGDALRAAEQEGPPEQAFERSCLAYLRFGRENMGVYRLMFASQLPRATGDQRLAVAGLAAFDLLLRSVQRHVAATDAEAIAIWIWSTLHGLVMLEAEGGPLGPRGGATATDVVRQMARAFHLTG